MKHKYYDLIVAKAANMDLVVFCKGNSGKWKEATASDIFYNESFLCLPQHKEAVLSSLNGVQAQANNEIGGGRFQNVYTERPETVWTSGGWYMCKECESRTEPKKEKRWIATFPWGGNAFYVTPESFETKESLGDYVDAHYGYRSIMLTHQIEVEV